jgi:hypothetical protein
MTQKIIHSFLKSPEDKDWIPGHLVHDVLDMRTLMVNRFHDNGPWDLYLGQGWEKYLEKEYSDAFNSIFPCYNTLRQRLYVIAGICAVILVRPFDGDNRHDVYLIATSIGRTTEEIDYLSPPMVHASPTKLDHQPSESLSSYDTPTIVLGKA